MVEEIKIKTACTTLQYLPVEAGNLIRVEELDVNRSDGRRWKLRHGRRKKSVEELESWTPELASHSELQVQVGFHSRG